MDANGFLVRVRCGVRVQRSNRRTLGTASDGARTERDAFRKRARALVSTSAQSSQVITRLVKMMCHL